MTPPTGHERHAKALSAAAPAGPARRRRPWRSLAGWTLALGATAALVVGVYDIGGGQKKGESPGGGAAAAQGLSSAQQTRVAELMGRLKAQPNDVATLIAIGDTYFEAHEYNSAGGWMKRAVQADPKNVTARLALGAAEFNISDAADAGREWRRVIAVDPKNVEAFYDLGFMYISRQPPDMKDAKRMWNKVMKLAPNSTVAKTVAMHLKGLDKK